jgi:hypothetical protein
MHAQKYFVNAAPGNLSFFQLFYPQRINIKYFECCCLLAGFYYFILKN